MSNEPSRTPDEMRRKLSERMSRIGHKVLVLSGKGGVGKSTVAVNLAVALSRAKQRVGLLDVDVHGPSVPKMLDLEYQALLSGREGMKPVRFNDHLVVASIGFLLQDEDSAVIWRGPRKYGLIRQFLCEVEWGDLDFLVIDAPPGTGDEPLAVCELTEEKLPRPPGARPDRGALIVTTPQDVAVTDVRKCIRFCREVGVPVHGLIENMSGLTCPHCRKRIEVFRGAGGQDLADEYGIPLLGRIPLEPAIVRSGDDGRPITGIDGNDGSGVAAAVFQSIVEQLLAVTGKAPPAART